MQLKIDYDKYLLKARQAIQKVFDDEYYGLLALPFPKVSFLTPEQENFASGQYYISIGNRWQIHLNFGKLPKHFREFVNEVKVLTRHEIEHRQTCPFDVLTHFRMIGAILSENAGHPNSVEKRLITQLAPSISNQIADIIIDTKNFQRFPEETFISELNWIKKSSSDDFQNVLRNGKLMFLMKEKLWGKNLDLFERDKDLIQQVSQLSAEFYSDGIDNKDKFIDKAQMYTSTFLELYNLDRKEIESQGFRQSSASNNVPCKDDSDGNGSFVFHDPDKVKEAINQIAQETSLQDFLDILDASGIKQLTEKEKEITWFEAQLVDEIPLIDDISTTSKDNLAYPSQWKLGDPVDELDLLLTLQTLPKILPGISTKKWEKQFSNLALDEPINSDLLLVIDTSGSMGKIIEKGSRLYESVLASFGFVKYFENKGAEIALVNFSTSRRVEPWSKDYNLIKESLLFAWGQGTEFPINDIIDLVETKKENSVILIMTDGEINNWEMTFELFKELLLLENKIFLFLIGNDSNIENYMDLKKYGGFVHSVNTMKEIRNIVYNEIL